jgi:hypothetical protein
VKAAQQYAREGKDGVVDIDITQFFDPVSHDILMGRIAPTIRDQRVLRRIGRYLRSGVLVDGVRVSSAEGTPQGGPLSPLPANIYLDALDRELERRGHCFRRSAADGNIYVRSEQAAEGTFRTTKAWIEKHLRRQVNESKSGIGRSGERQFLGVRRTREQQIEIALESRKKFKGKVGELWRSGQSRSREELRDAWKRYVQGWWGYFQLAEYRRPVGKLEGWIDATSGNAFGCAGTARKGVSRH